MIPEADLRRLELKTRELMGSGQWQKALEEIRAAAVLYGESSDGLVRKVISEALRQGHVRPLTQVEDPG